MQGDSREAALEAKQKLAQQLLEDRAVARAGLEEALRADAVLKRLKALEQRIAHRQSSVGGDIDDVEVWPDTAAGLTMVASGNDDRPLCSPCMIQGGSGSGLA